MVRIGPLRWNVPFALIGVVHLLPLPGAPRSTSSFETVRERALRDAEAYVHGGAHALLIENFGDIPFRKNRVEPHVIAAMAVIIDKLRQTFDLPLGVNVLRNDAQAALGIAAVTEAEFIRVNIHIGAMITDQGLIEGQADETLRYRALLGSSVEIWADVLVKHAVPPAPLSLEDVAQDTVERGLADILIVTGRATGKPPTLDEIRRVQSAVPNTPIIVGSGVTPRNLPQFLPLCAGAIVGTSVKIDGQVSNRVDPSRVRQLRDIIEHAYELPKTSSPATQP